MSQHKKDPQKHELKNNSNGIDWGENSGSGECKNANYNSSNSNNVSGSNDYYGNNCDNKSDGGKVLQLFAVVVHLGMNTCVYRFIYKLLYVDSYIRFIHPGTYLCVYLRLKFLF